MADTAGDRAWADDMRQKRLADVRAKIDAKEQLTRADRVALLGDAARALDARITAAMKDRPDRAAFRHALDCVIVEMMARALVADERREALEERITKLERMNHVAAPESIP